MQQPATATTTATATATESADPFGPKFKSWLMLFANELEDRSSFIREIYSTHGECHALGTILGIAGSASLKNELIHLYPDDDPSATFARLLHGNSSPSD